MHRFRSLFLLVLLTSLACVLSPREAPACSCDGFATLPQELEWSREIYTGVVVAIEPVPMSTVFVLITLRPHWIWRGTPVNGMFQVITGVDQGVCGIHFEMDTEYLVFAHPSLDAYSGAGLCGRTHAIYDGDPDIAALGPPIVTPAGTSTWGTVKVRYR